MYDDVSHCSDKKKRTVTPAEETRPAEPLSVHAIRE